MNLIYYKKMMAIYRKLLTQLFLIVWIVIRV